MHWQRPEYIRRSRFSQFYHLVREQRTTQRIAIVVHSRAFILYVTENDAFRLYFIIISAYTKIFLCMSIISSVKLRFWKYVLFYATLFSVNNNNSHVCFTHIFT